MAFDRARLERVLELARAQLRGEWLLVGGAAAALWFEAERTTEDVDLFGLGGTNAERTALMDLATSAGIPVEAVNSTADYFVRRVAGWRDELVPLATAPDLVIYRPSATLFLALKLRRLSATDLADCLALIAHCAATTEPLDRAKVLADLRALPATAGEDLAARRDVLAAALG